MVNHSSTLAFLVHYNVTSEHKTGVKLTNASVTHTPVHTHTQANTHTYTHTKDVSNLMEIWPELTDWKSDPMFNGVIRRMRDKKDDELHLQTLHHDYS